MARVSGLAAGGASGLAAGSVSALASTSVMAAGTSGAARTCSRSSGALKWAASWDSEGVGLCDPGSVAGGISALVVGSAWDAPGAASGSMAGSELVI